MTNLLSINAESFAALLGTIVGWLLIISIPIYCIIRYLHKRNINGIILIIDVVILTVVSLILISKVLL